MNKKAAVFFDRDGVLNVDYGYTYRPEELTWIEGAKEAIRYCKRKGYAVFVVTNQSGVARGYYTEQDVAAFHAKMQADLDEYQTEIDAFYYCPHLPGAEIKEYALECQCRKPGPEMLLQAIRDWKLEREKCWMVGDKETDMLAAKAAGVKGIFFGGGSLLAVVRERIQ